MNLVLILPSLVSGGLEKVLTELAWYYHEKEGIQVSVISLSKGELFYPLPPGMEVVMPPFGIEQMPRALFLMRLMPWLRKQVKQADPEALLSFGGKYNAFVALSVAGLPVRIFVSDRSRPSISYGRFLDWLNPRVYKRVSGIIAQTEQARTWMEQRTGHSNIRVIGNPIKLEDTRNHSWDPVILNVGRFVSTKQQGLLVDYFAQINPEGWKLCFIGGGHMLEEVQSKVAALGLEDRVVFEGEASVVEEQYYRCSIFAFTSVSEGFPNALAEAMAARLACISFDCEAGPADLIRDGENGFLIGINDHDTYRSRLEQLIQDESLRARFGQKARERIMEYSTEKIGDQYLDFMNQSIA
jgi:GalNAc-alpha-(1->4)-GalNAc-alpha-(1->3)-diNAcBac-PP-undecaprenol alpha-1,4-N-acetyl-D-galactosaminyltransferase